MPQTATPVNYTLPYTLRFSGPRTYFRYLWLLITGEHKLANSGHGNAEMWWTDDLAMVILFTFTWLGSVTQKVHLSEDRLSYRKWWSAKKEMEYSSLSRVSFYFRDSRYGIGPPVVELWGYTGESLLINLFPLKDGAKIWVLHDVLKRKAPQAKMERSFESIFPEPGDPDRD